MKILIVINSLGYGGAEKQAVVDANALYKRGHDVTLAFQKNGELSKLLNKNISLYKIRWKNIILSCLQMISHFLLHRYQIIHAHMFWAEKIAAFAGRIFKQKIIMNEHGLGVWRKWYHRILMKTISISAHKIINCCDATKKNRLTLEKIKPGKLITIYNSIDINRKKTLPGEKNSRFTVGFVGRFDPVKRLEFYITLAKLLKRKIPDVKFVLVGDGPERENFEELVKQNHLENNFTLTGFVLEPWNYLENFDVFFMPSKREAFSIALLEAGAFSVPAIAFDVGGNAELIKDGATGYIIRNERIEEVADKVFYLYENPQEKIKLGNNAYWFVTGNFSVRQRIDRLEVVYKSTMKS